MIYIYKEYTTKAEIEGKILNKSLEKSWSNVISLNGEASKLYTEALLPSSLSNSSPKKWRRQLR